MPDLLLAEAESRSELRFWGLTRFGEVYYRLELLHVLNLPYDNHGLCDGRPDDHLIDLSVDRRLAASGNRCRSRVAVKDPEGSWLRPATAGEMVFHCRYQCFVPSIVTLVLMNSKGIP